jgi:maleate isomerase
MYGAEGRIGLLVPSVNTVAEPEIGQLVPAGVAVYAARMRNQRADTDDSRAMLQHVERAADELGSAHVGVLAFACTASSFVEGEAGEIDLCRRMEAAGKAPAVTTSRAVREALVYLGARRIVVATPYVEELNQLEKAYLEEEGAEVVGISGMGIVEAYDIGNVTPEEAGEFAVSGWKNGADALFISCTNLRTIEALQPLAEEVGKPVISSNSATCWASLRTLGISDELAALALTGRRASELSV